jgi:crotonobetainyl-CoA:carnitine CoA-transferase CaiB-like acyl-CoA transferase
VTVLEFATIIATPYACSLLADLGARVIKVEAPEGDGLRNLGGGVSAAKTTAGKESICIDLKLEEGRTIARQLIERADVLVHNYRPGVPERLGIGYEQVAAYNPGIVYVSATGYGSDGPDAHRPSAHPIAGASMGGALWQAGAAMPPPDTDDLEAIRETARRFMRANELNPDPNTSMVIATAALLGLYARRGHGTGQHIQTNMMVGNAYANFDDFLSYEGKPDRPLVDADLHGLNALYRLYPTAEGWVFLACPREEEWRALCRALDRSDLLDDPRFATGSARCANDAELAALLGAVLCTRPADAWEDLLTRHDVGCVRADRQPAGEFWECDEHVYRNGFVREAEHPRLGTYWRHGPLVTFSDTPERCGAGVLAGQHTNQLLRELGYSADQIAALRASRVIGSEEP